MGCGSEIGHAREDRTGQRRHGPAADQARPIRGDTVSTTHSTKAQDTARPVIPFASRNLTSCSLARNG